MLFAFAVTPAMAQTVTFDAGTDNIPANGFAVVTRVALNSTNHSISGLTDTPDLTDANTANDVLGIPASTMPDLAEFFDNGGTILLKTRVLGADGSAPGSATAAVGAIKITEIMWGTDATLEAANAGTGDNSQWIELYNTTDAPISLASWILEFTVDYETELTAGVAEDTATTAVEGVQGTIDAVSNLGNPGFWEVKGQSGRTQSTNNADAKDLISMYRKLKQVNDTAHADHGKDDGNPHRAGTWVASVKPRRNLSGRRVGTPGDHPVMRIGNYC